MALSVFPQLGGLVFFAILVAIVYDTEIKSKTPPITDEGNCSNSQDYRPRSIIEYINN